MLRAPPPARTSPVRRPGHRAAADRPRGRRRSRPPSTRGATCSCTSSGAEWAKEHHLTLDGLQKVVPRSNDPGCSAGFGMGLVMGLGPQIIATGGKSALKTCEKLPTRLRAVHLRAQPRPCAHARRPRDDLPRSATRARSSARATRRTARRVRSTTTGSRSAARTRRRRRSHAVRLAAAGSATSTRTTRSQCWYRYWIEQAARARDPERAARPAPALPRASPGAQRAGCIAGAVEGRLRHAGRRRRALCASLSAADARRLRARRREPGLRGASRGGSSRSSATAGRIPAGARGGPAPPGSGRRSTSLENGRFLAHGCPLSRRRCARACACRRPAVAASRS